MKAYFTGSRLEFLNRYCDKYILLRGRNRAKFWHQFFKDWWQTYPWRLADDEEPPTGDSEKMKELSEVGDDEELKGTVEKRLRDVSLVHSLALASKLSQDDRHLLH